MSKSFITFNFSNAAAIVCLVFSFSVLKDEIFFPGIFFLTVKFSKSPFNCSYMFSLRKTSYVKSLETNIVMINTSPILKTNVYLLKIAFTFM